MLLTGRTQGGILDVKTPPSMEIFLNLLDDPKEEV